MSIQLYNTLSRSKEPLEPVTPGKVGIYVCGPTVYSDPHLGHARGPIVFDTLRRWLERRGLEVRLVSNVTDVGHLTDDADQGADKLLERAKLERLEPMEVADKYFWTYFDALAALNIRRPSIAPRATGHIPEQIELTEELIARGLAYERSGSVYFDVSAWEPYGELSGRNIDELVEGTRIDSRLEKDDPRDFALWKRADPEHLMRWNSPWGEGFPGWHIECSVMSTKYLGDEFDVHGGGLDLIFPHHESEIAQAKGVGKPFARLWMHWNMMTLDGEKMAKSKDHFVTLTDLFERYEPAVVRFHLLRSHYRSVSDFSDAGLEASGNGLARLRDAYRQAHPLGGDSEPETGAFAAAESRFATAMDDDLNTPQAIAVLFDVAKEVNRLDAADGPQNRAAALFFDAFLGAVLGVVPTPGSGSSEPDRRLLDSVVTVLLEQRNRARLDRDFATSDAIRDRLEGLGISIEDMPEGSRWRPM